MTNIPLFEKRSLAITVMNAELPPFKNGEQNSESASTLDHSLTPSRFLGYIAMKDKI